ncbi:hypothetical protein K435DRAFT_876613 [Dendrothele bispora CBS 962.96]|uniref:Uncharacterized protein n=1 Tax=Dendrothele bispora (strain CBS 962.96) TaxID=1314807 RepID=A0A4S8KRQ8_DENBC|nr:hypothetical protein K435DRAFT_876613 [Dendrothele bispora CBS 962.96]
MYAQGTAVFSIVIGIMDRKTFKNGTIPSLQSLLNTPIVIPIIPKHPRPLTHAHICTYIHTYRYTHHPYTHERSPRGVDFIKLDFVTPGSPMLLPKNSSGTVIAYHEAITKAKSKRPMRLDISWKLVQDPTHYSIWSSNADSFRTDQDINNAGEDIGKSASG